MAEQPTAEVVATSSDTVEKRDPSRAQCVIHAFKWLFAIVGVFVAVCVIQAVVSVYGSVWLIRLGRLGVDASVSTEDLLLLGVAAQLVWLAVAIPWWRHVRRRGMGIDPTTVRVPVQVRYGRAADVAAAEAAVADVPATLDSPEPDSSFHMAAATEGSMSAPSPEQRPASRQPISPVRVARAVLAVALLGIGLQIVISMIITLVLPLFPEVERAYTELMESGGIDMFTPLSVLSVAVLAPVVEELTFRGVVFQFALRAVRPAWNKSLSPDACAELPISRAAFWIANALQALAFGVTHLNITQGLYAFAIGLVLGWLFGRTGQLRYSIALHLAINFASYFVEDILNVFGLFGGFGAFVLPVACVAVGIWLFMRSAPASPWSVEARCKPRE